VTTNALDGAFLRWCREQKQIPQKDFAKSLGISPEYLRKLENGTRSAKRRPDLSKKAGELLGVPAKKLRRELTS
jgi:transcriptional regulator with XRE-family HTH domain